MFNKTASYFKSFSTKDAPPGTTSDSVKERNEPHPFGLIHAKRVLCFFAFSDLPSAILAKLNSATTLLASTTLYIYKNVIIIFQYETKAKTTENRSGVRWQLINRP